MEYYNENLCICSYIPPGLVIDCVIAYTINLYLSVPFTCTIPPSYSWLSKIESQSLTEFNSSWSTYSGISDSFSLLMCSSAKTVRPCGV